MLNSKFSIKEVSIQNKDEFNHLASHPLQSWDWGLFRVKTGIEVVRLGIFENNKLTETAQLTIHPIPFSSFTIGYLPKGGIPSKEMLSKLVEVGKQHKCIFIKLEPNIEAVNNKFHPPAGESNFKYNLLPSPHPLFTKYTFRLDLTKTEEELLKNMHPKTRYNIKVARKHGVTVQEETCEEAFKTYLHLQSETTRRQKFFAHSQKYHRLMWETLAPEGIAHLFTAKYLQDQKEHTLVSWIVFLFNGILYYPYGGSSNLYKNVMASNLLMWEVIVWGKKNGAKLFDMWGSLGPNPDPKDPWYGFHRFKQGYGPNLIEFTGSFDLVIEPFIYRLYNLIHQLREVMLRIKSSLASR